MKFMDALNILVARGVTSELVGATTQGESFLILTDGPMPMVNFAAHSAYGVTPFGVTEGHWLMEEGQVVVRWDVRPDDAMAVGIDKLHFNNAGLRGLNDRLEARMRAAT